MSPLKLSRLVSPAFFKELVMVLLALASVFLLVVEIFFQLNLQQSQLFAFIDLVICVLFLADFFLHYYLSDRKATFFSRHWLDLLATLPFVSPLIHPLLSIKLLGPFSVLHIARLIRLGIRIRILLEVSLEYTRHAYLIYIFTVVCFIQLTGAAGFFFFEHSFNPNVNSFNDAIWWSIVTATTIGYGDIFPVTTGGRIVAVIMMIFGIAISGTFIATIDSAFLSRRLSKFKKPGH